MFTTDNTDDFTPAQIKTITFIKAKGRVAFFKGEEFDHQQFRGHWAYRNPEGYIAHLIELEREAAEYKATINQARREETAAYLAKRAARASNFQLNLF
jgi:hypothetical protein